MTPTRSCETLISRLFRDVRCNVELAVVEGGITLARLGLRLRSLLLLAAARRRSVMDAGPSSGWLRRLFCGLADRVSVALGQGTQLAQRERAGPPSFRNHDACPEPFRTRRLLPNYGSHVTIVHTHTANRGLDVGGGDDLQVLDRHPDHVRRAVLVRSISE